MRGIGVPRRRHSADSGRPPIGGGAEVRGRTHVRNSGAQPAAGEPIKQPRPFHGAVRVLVNCVSLPRKSTSARSQPVLLPAAAVFCKWDTHRRKAAMATEASTGPEAVVESPPVTENHVESEVKPAVVEQHASPEAEEPAAKPAETVQDAPSPSEPAKDSESSAKTESQEEDQQSDKPESQQALLAAPEPPKADAPVSEPSPAADTAAPAAEVKAPTTEPADTSKSEASAKAEDVKADAAVDVVADELKDLAVKDDTEPKKADEPKPSESDDKPASSEAPAEGDASSKAPEADKPAAEGEEKGKKQRRCVIV
ncbi:brain acid soluble protein 1 isoform X1 [Dermacentor silvarum]|nr:brain acid soluble protein 1 isoform X1 [Dermacentor silvarum]